jgi:hypothetical protein
MMRGEHIGREHESNLGDKFDQLGWGDFTV